MQGTKIRDELACDSAPLGSVFRDRGQFYQPWWNLESGSFRKRNCKRKKIKTKKLMIIIINIR